MCCHHPQWTLLWSPQQTSPQVSLTLPKSPTLPWTNHGKRNEVLIHRDFTLNWRIGLFLSCGYLNQRWFLFAEIMVSVCTSGVCCTFIASDLIVLQCCSFHLLIHLLDVAIGHLISVELFLISLCSALSLLNGSLLVILMFLNHLMLLSFHLILFFCRFLFHKALSCILLRMPNSLLEFPKCLVAWGFSKLLGCCALFLSWLYSV